MRLVSNAKHFDFAIAYVVKHANISNAQPILWFVNVAEAFDPAFALACGLMEKMAIDSILYLRSIKRRKRPEIISCLWRERDLMFHSGHIMAYL